MPFPQSVFVSIRRPGRVVSQKTNRREAWRQQRLSVRGNRGILGTLFGVNNYNGARVLSITQVNPRRNNVTVRGVASSGRMAYNPYGVGAYGMLGSNYAQQTADLSFRCTVDYRGYIRDIDINSR